MKYKEFSQLNLPAFEKEILEKWQQEQTFEKSVTNREGATPFVFYEGPPSANGMPGIHHVISRTLKDLVCRYKTMQGFQVKRKGGWDTHGLPIELGVEKELGITKEDIGKSISVEDYNKKCREAVLRFKDKWDEITLKMGYWVDLKNPYITYENNYIESVWWLLSKMYNRGLLYESVSIQPYSPAAGTGLSSHELNMPGAYKDVKDTSATVLFKVRDYKQIWQSIETTFKNLIVLNTNNENEYDYSQKNISPKELKNKLLNTVRKEVIENKSINATIIITRKGISEVSHFIKTGYDVIAVEHLVTIIEKSTFVISQQNIKRDDGSIFNYLLCYVQIGNKYFIAKTVIRQAKNQFEFYDLSLTELKKEHKKTQLEYVTQQSEPDDIFQLGSSKDNKLFEIFTFPKAIFQILASNVDYSKLHFMAWTTTPWTLPSNLGLTVGPNIDYAVLYTINPYTHQYIYVIIADKLVAKYFKKENENKEFTTYKNDGKNIPYQYIMVIKGNELSNINYQQLLPCQANTPNAINEITPKAQPFKVVLGDFVTTDDGTGIVHTSPAFGADDYKIGKKNNLGILTLVDRQGKFVSGVGEYSNRYVKDYKNEPNYVDVNVDIAVKLKLEGKAFKVEKYEHNYPHCWRTDKPILYYPLDAWFIKTTALKDRMVENNKLINWKPANTGTGRFGNWLENIQDWNLSRSRFWGTPLPIWKTEDGLEEICIGSIDELTNKYVEAVNVGLNKESKIEILNSKIQVDLHKPFIDAIVLVSPTGKPMFRVPDLIDVWFDSGAMPYAQHHFPFENKELFAQSYPADFIAEGVDQTRGWFYTLHAIAALVKEDIEEELRPPTPQGGSLEPLSLHSIAALHNQNDEHNRNIEVNKASHPNPPPKAGEGATGLAYKTVVSNGLVLDKNGVKMSKRLGNIVDPFATIETYGADATRWYLVTNASPWDNLKFDSDGIKEVQRKFFGTLYNTYQFFALYANVDGFTYNQVDVPNQQRPEIDRWILSTLNTLINTVTNALNDYEPTLAGRAIEEFVDSHLSNWHVRLSRRRFWKPSVNEDGTTTMATDKLSAYQTLYICVETVAKLIAPIAPFFADTIFTNLNAVTNKNDVESIHLTEYPKADPTLIDTDLEQRMALAQDACSLILSLRKKVITINGEVGIKVRQPLQKVMIPVFNPTMQTQLQKVEDLIKAETNIKEIEYLDPNNSYINKKIKPNFAALGKKLGQKMKLVPEILNKFSQNDITTLENEGKFIINVDNQPIELALTDVEISTDDVTGWAVASKGLLTTALDITITSELQHEGNARELINRIQKIRKDTNLNLTDRIIVEITDIPMLTASFIQYNDYICGEILADRLQITKDYNVGTTVEINENQLFVNVKVNDN